MIYPVVNCSNPKLEKLVMLANLAGCTYQDKDINEQYRDIKKCPPVLEHRTDVMKNEKFNNTDLIITQIGEKVKEENGKWKATKDLIRD